QLEVHREGADDPDGLIDRQRGEQLRQLGLGPIAMALGPAPPGDGEPADSFDEIEQRTPFLHLEGFPEQASEQADVGAQRAVDTSAAATLQESSGSFRSHPSKQFCTAPVGSGTAKPDSLLTRAVHEFAPNEMGS